MAFPTLNAPCFACGKEGNFSILLARTEGRIYLPNQAVRRKEPPHPGYGEVAFCASCMRKIEDSVRTTIAKLQAEHEVTPPTVP